jgi:glycosyltransferase involved in cell wall biosynthesis
MTARGVIFDLVAAQSPSYMGRGIARYSTDLVRAMVRCHPELVSAVVLHPDLPVPGGLDDLGDRLTTEPDWASGSVLHLSSVFELEVPVRTFWPREASANRLLTAVTLYDLIPDLFPGWYLEDPGLRRRWRCCREVVRTADAVLTLSESTKEDAVALLGVPERRLSVIGSGTAPVFRHAESRQAAVEVARAGVEGLEGDFIIYNGAFTPGKNMDRLVQAYASLPPAMIERHQLVIVCAAPPLTRNHYLVMSKRLLGREDRVLIPGYVPDEVLVGLYQSATLAVFPSFYEGYGLPVIESMACGAPTIAADNSSLREILPREARFEPTDPSAIAQAIARGVNDRSYRAHLSALAAKEPPSWTSVADKAAAVFERLLRRPRTVRPGWRKRPQLALVGAPPELAHATASLASLDRFRDPVGDADEPSPPGTGTGRPGTGPDRPVSCRVLPQLDAWRGGYDAVVYWLDTTEMVVGTGTTRAIEAFAAQCPGRLIVLVDQGTGPAGGKPANGRYANGKPDGAKAGNGKSGNGARRSNEWAGPAVERSGAKVLCRGGSWEETARLVVETARGMAG